MQIMKSTYDEVLDILGETPMAVTDVRIGPLYTAVALSNQHIGVALTPRELSDTACYPNSAATLFCARCPYLGWDPRPSL